MDFLLNPIFWKHVVHATLLLLISICAFTDIAYSKIYNKVIIPAAVIGIIGNSLHGYMQNPCLWGGLHGFLLSLSGGLIGFFIFAVVFFFGGMGGGDVKLMGSIGILGGYPFILYAIFFSALSGGLISIIIMLYHGQLLKSFAHVFRTLYTFILPYRVTEPLNPAESKKIPYGFGISIGTFWCWLLFFFLGKL